MLIKLEAVNFAYPAVGEQQIILENINLDIEQGDLLWIIGPSGAGKSTLVMLLNGLLRPSQGRVKFKEQDIYSNDFQVKQFRKVIGTLFQYPENNFFGQTVYEDVAYGPQNAGKQGNDLEKKVMSALDKAGIPKGYLNRSPFSLSGGEKRRVALAGALAREPEVLIMDEPTAGLDPVHKQQFLQLITELNGQGITLITVSHDMEQVCETGGKVVILVDGRIVAQGTDRAIMTSNELVYWGLEAPPVVELGRRLSLQHQDQPIMTEQEALSSILQLRGVRFA